MFIEPIDLQIIFLLLNLFSKISFEFLFSLLYLELLEILLLFKLLSYEVI